MSPIDSQKKLLCASPIKSKRSDANKQKVNRLVVPMPPSLICDTTNQSKNPDMPLRSDDSFAF